MSEQRTYLYSPVPHTGWVKTTELYSVTTWKLEFQDPLLALLREALRGICPLPGGTQQPLLSLACPCLCLPHQTAFIPLCVVQFFPLVLRTPVTG